MFLLRAQGIGRKSAFGKVVVAKNAAEALEKVTEGAILVTIGTDREMMPAIEKCAAIITEEGGLTSHAAVVGLSLGIPVIVGVKECNNFNQTMVKKLQLMLQTGVIYNGHASVL